MYTSSKKVHHRRCWPCWLIISAMEEFKVRWVERVLHSLIFCVATLFQRSRVCCKICSHLDCGTSPGAIKLVPMITAQCKLWLEPSKLSSSQQNGHRSVPTTTQNYAPPKVRANMKQCAGLRLTVWKIVESARQRTAPVKKEEKTSFCLKWAFDLPICLVVVLLEPFPRICHYSLVPKSWFREVEPWRRGVIDKEDKSKSEENEASQHVAPKVLSKDWSGVRIVRNPVVW